MTITREQAEMLTELALACRPYGAPRWDRVGTFAAIGRVKGRSLAAVTIAVIQAAEDAKAETPAVIPSNGPHWRAPLPGDRPARTNAKAGAPDECRKHPGEHQTACRSCAVDHIAHPDDPTPSRDTDAGRVLLEEIRARRERVSEETSGA